MSRIPPGTDATPPAPQTITQLGKTSTTYAIKLIKLHSIRTVAYQTFAVPDPEVFVYFDSLNVHRQYERLVYDTPGFLSALGGSVGLYLGLSCFSCMLLVLDSVPMLVAACCAQTRKIIVWNV